MRSFLLASLCAICVSSFGQTGSFYKENYRPQFHFTPPIHWTNDPNGLVYFEGEYHLFYQYNPFGNRWGHMTWGHAISTDLVHWEHFPIAIGEEKDTMIFSGSAVADFRNSSGFGTAGQIPLVAMYTAYIPEKTQSQHLAYSLDKGRTWTKYNRNPVLDLNKKDFRDPAVFWSEAGQKWVVATAFPHEHQVQFYSSPNLKDWKWMSSFGPAGDTTGIWECPDLFEVPVQGQPGKTKWILMHSPAPYMQYFVGEFDGTSFKNENPPDKIYRPDYGADYYAAITYKSLPANQPPISIGWANNWNYAQDIPTLPWKSTMSLPRELSVKKIGNEWILIQQPVKKLSSLREGMSEMGNFGNQNIVTVPFRSQTCEIELVLKPGKSISGIRLAKGPDHYIEIGFDPSANSLYIDRSKSGDSTFNPEFPKQSRYQTPVRVIDGKVKLHLFFDKSILEVFANDGEQVMTMQLFPDRRNEGIELFRNGSDASFVLLRCWRLKSIWQ